MYTFRQPHRNTRRWTKDHPLVTIIGNPLKLVSTRRQFTTNALWCYFHAFLTKVEPKNYKEAMKESCWIKAMQEEIYEFERLECVDRLVAKGYRQEEGIDFKESFAPVAHIEVKTYERPNWDSSTLLVIEVGPAPYYRTGSRPDLVLMSACVPASNWLERLPVGSISTLEDLTTHFLAQFFPSGRTSKLQNDILMFQQHQGESLLKHGLLREKNAKESWALLEDLALYDNESWNDPRDFAKPIKAISLPQDVPSTSDRHLIELENQVQRLMEAHLALNPPVPVNRITSSCEICSGPHDTRYCMENLEQDFVEYTSSSIDEAGGKCKEELGVDKSVATRDELGVEHFDKFLSRSELTYHKYLMCAPIPSMFLRNPIIVGGNPLNLKITCNIGHVHVEKAYINLNSPINVMTRMQYNWIMRKQLEPREDPEDFMIIEDVSSIVDPRLSQVLLGKPFVEISNMTHDLSLGIVKFANGTDEIAYKMPHQIEQYNSLSDLKEHTKLVYFRNEEDKRRGVDYLMNKILGFYKECLELVPEYLTGLEEKEGCEVKIKEESCKECDSESSYKTR
ncbi:MAK10-like protein [Tanacetum coccineum]